MAFKARFIIKVHNRNYAHTFLLNLKHKSHYLVTLVHLERAGFQIPHLPSGLVHFSSVQTKFNSTNTAVSTINEQFDDK